MLMTLRPSCCSISWIAERRPVPCSWRPILTALAFAIAFAPLYAPATARAQDAEGEMAATDPHFDVLSEESYPRASQCAACHSKIYEEWRSSSHAYAAISPVFHT